MTAATGPRYLGMMDDSPRQFPIGNVAPLQGWLMGRYPIGHALAGKVDPIGTDPELQGIGICRTSVSTTAVPATAQEVYVDSGIFPFFATSVDETWEGQPIFGQDNQTVGLTDGGGQYPLIGVGWYAESTTVLHCKVGPAAIAEARAILAVQSTASGGTARGVFTNLNGAAAYANGVLTLAVGALPAQDGITVALGDTFLALKNLTNLPAAAQAGPWVITSLGSVSTSPTAERPPWYLTGAPVPLEIAIRVGPEGAIFANSIWAATATGAALVDTTDPAFQFGWGALNNGPEPIRAVRGVVTSNVASLAAFASVLGGTIIDGVTYAAGQLVLLVGQTTATQNGPYIVGTVAAGAAPLSRPAWFQTGASIPAGFLLVSSEGQGSANTLWELATVAPITVDTTSLSWLCIASPPTVEPGQYKARCVVTANTSLAAFAGVAGGSTTNSDGVTCVAGDIVLLAAQTTATQNGPYVVGTIAAGSAPLTRPPWFQTGSTQAGGFIITLSGEGTYYKNTEWKAALAASTFVVDTTDPKFYPKWVSWTSALVAGVVTAGGASPTAGAPTTAFVFSANTNILAQRKTPNTCTATIMYSPNTAAVAAGVGATGAASAFATVAAGTVNASDLSTMIVTYYNHI